MGDHQSETDSLLIQVGADHCCYAFYDPSNRSFSQVSFISFEGIEAEEELPAVMARIRGDFKEVLVCAAFPEALLVPQKFAAAAESLCRVTYDDTARVPLKDSLPEWQMITAYSLPLHLHKLLKERFASANFFHAYTPALKVGNGFVNEDQIDIYFTTRYFRVLVKQDHQLVLAQTYSYKTPLDVVYYLLKICYEFGMEQSRTHVILSGLIDRESALYEELHHYFLNLNFVFDQGYKLPDTEYPHYYFTILYYLASCVS
jgi:hypothetical protein